MNKIKSFLAILIAFILTIPTIAFAVEEPPGGFGGGPGGEPGGNSSTSVSYTGANVISSDTSELDKTYTSSTGSENALLVNGGESTLNNCTVTKTGDSDGDNADFYGTNAAVLVTGATLNIKGGTITTNGAHANAVFAYGEGIINISDATIKTSSNNSGGVMVTGGGTLTADNLTVETDGNSSAPIRSDRGGGNLTVNKGTYKSNGMGSPAIYSTANIVVNNAKLISTSSEGVVVEGKNSVTLNGATLEATNTTLNGNSETYKAIFIYQSMSGDAEVGTSSFTSKDSKITNNKGDVIFVTNTNTVITLENNEIINNDETGGFLRATTSKWGTSGSNGGTVELNLTNQKVNGNIVIDSVSTLNMTMKSGSVLTGTIDGKDAKEIKLSLSKDSIISLTGDSYVSSLENELSDNSNIYSNGYKLYANGEEVKTNEGTYTPTETKKETKTETKSNNMLYYILGGSGLLLISIVVVVIIVIKNKKKKVE
jgi:hypothetical protein